MIFKKQNRDNKTKPKLGRYWCMACDAYVIRPGEKCRVCGARSPGKHRKKD